jgi:curved DNA-binding protein CbpA
MSGQALTYYDILRVNRRAEPDRVRAAYRRLAQQCHPDKMRGDARAQSLMAELNEAYAVLSDPRQRARYDEHIDAIHSSRQRAHQRFVARLEDMGPSWPWSPVRHDHLRGGGHQPIDVAVADRRAAALNPFRCRIRGFAPPRLAPILASKEKCPWKFAERWPSSRVAEAGSAPGRPGDSCKRARAASSSPT